MIGTPPSTSPRQAPHGLRLPVQLRPMASTSRPSPPQAPQARAPDATSQQVGQGQPQPTLLLSVWGCEWGPTPLSSDTLPHPIRAGEDASSISLPGGTPGWLWNLRPGSRGRGPASTRRLGPAPATSGRAGTPCHLQSPPAANLRLNSMHAPTRRHVGPQRPPAPRPGAHNHAGRPGPTSSSPGRHARLIDDSCPARSPNPQAD